MVISVWPRLYVAPQALPLGIRLGREKAWIWNRRPTASWMGDPGKLSPLSGSAWLSNTKKNQSLSGPEGRERCTSPRPRAQRLGTQVHT